MDKKKTTMALFAVALVFIIVLIAIRNRDRDKGYVFDRNSKIKFKDVQTAMGNIDFERDHLSDYFSDGVVNTYTLKFFKSIEKRFKDSKNFDDHFESVHEYLFSVLPPDEAEELFRLYKKYIKYQQNLMDMSKVWGNPQSPEEAISYLHRLQEYRRGYFGKDVADILFGASIKAQEYPIRRSVIVNDDDLYGAEKEEKIQKLTRDMWGDESQAVEEYRKPYSRYREKLKMYSKDLSEMGSEDERREKIKEFRDQFFSPEVVKRLEEVDSVIAVEKQREENYYDQEERIRNNPNYDTDEKEQLILELQNKLFGDDADAFRRRLNIEKGLEKLRNR